MSPGGLIRWLTAGKYCGMHVSDHVSPNYESFPVLARASKTSHHDASTRNETISVGLNRKLSTWVFVWGYASETCLRAATNVPACECTLQHKVSNLPRATCCLGVTALRGKERQSDWHEGVYGKQEQGLAGWLAITQECTLLSSSFFFLRLLAGSVRLLKHQQ